jgi:anti-sigma-K factor RskA
MIDEPLKELASLYVAGALPPAEGHEFESAMERSVELQLFVSDAKHSLDAMAAGLPRRTPSPALKTRILREVDSRSEGAAPQQRAAGFDFWQMVPWALAAGLTFLCVFVAAKQRSNALTILQLKQSLAEAEAQNQSTERRTEVQRAETLDQRNQLNQRIIQQITDQQRQSAAQAAKFVERIRELEKRQAELTSKPRTAAPIPSTIDPNSGGVQTETVTVPGGPFGAGGAATFLGVLRSTKPAVPAVGAVAWEASSQHGTVTIENLVLPGPDRDYQLWLFVDGVPISGGLLRVDATGRVQASFSTGQKIDAVQKFAITDERRGGVQNPEGEVIMASN